MSNAVSLKQWSDGTTPEKNDLLSWSNLILERSLQVKDVHADPISQYFFTQWLVAEKPPELLAHTFERTFSAYNVSFQIRVMDTLAQQGVLQPIDLLDKVKHNGLLHRHLVTLPAVWKEMQPHQFREELYTTFDSILRFERDKPQQPHAAWAVLANFKTPKDRRSIFNAVISPAMKSEFGFLSESKARFSIETFHTTICKLGECWGLASAQIMYALLRTGHDSTARELERYPEFIEPYANDIRELIQFSTSARDERIREHLPESMRPVTLDMMLSFAVAMEPINIFLERDNLPSATYDPAAAEALGAAF